MGRNYSVLSTVANIVNLFDRNETYSVHLHNIVTIGLIS